MDVRYSLRFETGDRRGESVPIPANGLTIGRKPGNSVQIQDNSVSGQHAELVVEPAGVLVRDLGSTNGTRIGSERVLEQRLADGDTVLFGNVRFTFHDREGTGPMLEGELAPASGVTAPDAGLERVRSDLVEKAGRSSPAAAIALGVGVLAAAGVGAWFWLGAGAGSKVVQRAVEPVPGNLLAAGYSFEEDRDAWEPQEGAPEVFLLNAAASWSGAQGVRADLDAGEWAIHRSPEFRAAAEREITARARLRAGGETEARLGLEFSAVAAGDAAVPTPVVAWAAPVTGREFSECALRAAVPPGYASARVLILARARDGGGGRVDADDASATEAPLAVRPAAELASTGLYLHGEPPTNAHLFRVDRVLVSGLEMTREGAAPGREGAPLSARVDGPRIVVEAAGERPEVLLLRAEAPLVRGGIASTGEGGYRTHGATIEREAVESLLLGSGRDLVRVQFAAPCTLRGEVAGSVARFSVALGGAEPRVALQLDFSAEKGAAEDLAHAARGAERQGSPGAAMAKWDELLDRHPYEQALVEEAEASRARILQAGLDELRAVRGEAERAVFFGLPALFRAAREKALSIGRRFAGSEVEAQAVALAEDLAQRVAGLEADHHREERARLEAVLKALERQNATGLANEVRARLARPEGG